ncbi:MAG: trp operon repressor [Spirochaetaceae bacterium]|nr:trp operon repressor [Spirochaetaceae bacterium]
MTDEMISRAVRELSKAVAATESAKEVEEFLVSLLTQAEVKAIAARWILVKEIARGTPQRDIAKKYALSLCKITRGSRELKKENAPFRRMLERSRRNPQKPQNSIF